MAREASTVTPTLDALRQVDGALQACAAEATPRAQAALSLGLLETRLEEELAEIARKIEDNAKASSPTLRDADIEALIAKADRAAAALVKDELASADSRSDLLKALRRIDALRLQSDFQLRLAVMAAPLKGGELAKDLFSQAKKTFAQSLAGLDDVSDEQRAKEIPALLGRMAETRMALETYDHLSTPGDTSAAALERMNRELDLLRKRAFSEAEKLELSQIEVQAYFSLAGSEPGQAHSFTLATPEQVQRARERIAEVQAQKELVERAKIPDALKGRLQSQGETIVGVFPFYMDRSTRSDENVSALVARLRSNDAHERAIGQAVARELLEKQPGSYVTNELIRRRSEFADRSPELDMGAQAKLREARAADYDQRLSGTLKEQQSRYRLPSYAELTSSPDGSLALSLKIYQEQLGKIMVLKETEAQKPGTVTAEDSKSALLNAELSWISLQCLRQATGESPPDETTNVVSPFGMFRVNLKTCRGPLVQGHGRSRREIARDATLKDMNSAIRQMTADAVNLNTSIEVGWIAAEFAFDATTGALTVGGAMLANKALTMGIKKAASVYAEKAAVKMLASGAGFAGASLTANAIDGAKTGTKAFLLQGLRNDDWNTKHFTDNFAYTSGNTSIPAHAVRVLASGLAVSGMGKLWKLAGGTKAGNALVEKANERLLTRVAGTAVRDMSTGMVASRVGELSALPFDKNAPSPWQVLDGFRKKEEWAANIPMLGSISNASQRLFSPAAMRQLSTLPLDASDEASLEAAGKCATNVSLAPEPKAPLAPASPSSTPATSPKPR
jgi:hypothetical protein